MNPYESRQREKQDADAPQVHVDQDQLRKTQLRLVIRLAVLACLTAVISLAAIVFVGIQMMPVALVVALVLGIAFTIPWK